MSKPSSQTNDSGRVSFLVAASVLVAVGVVAYSNSFQGPFLFDDFRNIKDNPHIRLTQLDGQQLLDAARRSPSRFRPISNLTFALNYYLGRYHVWGYHLVNLCVHLVCSLLVYLFALATFERLTLSQDSTEQTRSFPTHWAALAAALIFVSHPLQTQAVTYIVQRMASLATLFYVATLLLYLRGRTASSARKRWGWWTAAVIGWLVTLGCKEIAVTLPLAVLLYEWYFFQDLNRGWLKRCSIYVLPVALVLLILAAIQSSQLMHWFDIRYEVRDFTLAERLLTQLRVVAYYLSLVIWPLPGRLCLTHDIGVSHSLLNPVTTLLSLLAILGLLAVAVLTARRYRIVSFAILWYFLHLVIESSVIPLELVYEHRMYLPMVGISLLLGWGLFGWLPERRQAIVVTAVLVLSFTAATHLRNRVWQDPQTLWADVVGKYPEDARAHCNLAYTLVEQGELDRGMKTYRQALKLQPDYARAHSNFGNLLVEQGKVAEAIEHYRLAIQSNPGAYQTHNNLGLIQASQGKLPEAEQHYRRAIESKSDYAEGHFNLGVVLASQGKHAEARNHYQLALKHQRHYAPAHYNLGELLIAEGNVAEGINHYRQALELNPDDAPAHNNLGNALVSQGKPDQASEHYRQALAINPELSQTHKNLATLLAMQGQVAEAIEHYRQALAITPDSLDAHYNLALCLAAQGNQTEAGQHYRTALELAIAQGDEPLTEAIRKALEAD